MAALFFAALLATSLQPDYGYFVDELYYLACAQRLDAGYVDHPPLAVAVLALDRALLGDSLLALRWLPALCGALTLLSTARMARTLGGGARAQLLAMLCVAMAPVFVGIFSIYTTNCFEILFWTLAFGALVELGSSRDERLWWAVGVAAGLAFMSKHTSVLLAAALVLALPASPDRSSLRHRHVWIGGALALLVALPNLWWQVANDYASLAFYAASDREANVPTSVLAVLDEQIGSFNPAAFPVWAAGLFFFIGARRGARWRLIGWVAALLLAALLLAGRSRPDRIMGLYPVLLAGGAVQLEAVFVRRGFGWLRIALPAALVVVGLGVAPVLVPILGPELAARYTAALGEENEMQREVGTAALLLPLAHRMGSEELVADVERVAAHIDEPTRAKAVVLAEGYAPAGALELLGGEDVPPVFSPHNSYHHWGPPPADTELVIAVGFEPEQLEAWFDEVELVARSACRYCMGWRRDSPIALARGPRERFAELWPRLRRFGISSRKLYLLER